MLHCLQHHLFVARVRDLFCPHNLFFAEHFDGIEAQVDFAPNYENEQFSFGYLSRE